MSDSVENLVETTKKHYNERFSPAPSPIFCTRAPGRVNLIGEHVDYTGGFVLPMAIPYMTVIYGTGRVVQQNKAQCRIYSVNKGEMVEVDVYREIIPSKTHSWLNYMLGVVKEYFADLPPDSCFRFDAAVYGNVPLGSGLSSSASLEVATARFLECLTGKDTDAKTRALRCQKAENEFADSPCGIMDQYVSSAAKKHHALLIDCTSFECQHAPFSTTDASILICNSNVSHSIASGEYPVRVKQCQLAIDAIRDKLDKDIPSLRFVTMEQLEFVKKDMDPLIYKRAYHVITENERTLQAKDALTNGDFASMGNLMNESHASMRDDYQTSCEEIDILVDLAQSYPGVYGSRLTGGGFGGCTVTLVHPHAVNGLIQHLLTGYKEKTGKDCICFECSVPADGASCILP